MDDEYLKYATSRKFLDRKARSIVAMLFWEWKRHKRMYELTKF